MSHRKLSSHLQGQGTLVRSQFRRAPKIRQERSDFAWAVMAMKTGWSKPKWVTGGYGKFEIFKHRKFAYRRMREMKADKTLVWRPWNDMDNVKADTFVEWVVRKIIVETMEVAE